MPARRRPPALRAVVDVDIVYLCDLRFPGGTSTSLADEIVASTAAGFRVGVVHLHSTSLRAERPFNPRIRRLLDTGAATLVLPGERVRARLAIVKHPTVLGRALGGPLAIDAAQVLVTAGQVPRDPDGTVHYEPSTVDRNVIEALGRRPVWAPISLSVRAALGADVERGSITIADDDWHEVIDPAAWRCDRSAPVGDVPVIGRHSRPSALKWPATAADLLAAYPDDPAIRVRVLGGIAGVDELLGRVPQHWEVVEFGAMSPRDFLAGIDVFVYFHHPDMVEAFGRSTLEALATGAVAVVPPHFEPLFGEGCVYATPADVRGIVEHLHADRAAYAAQSERGRRVVLDRFSHAAHVARVTRLIGPPGTSGSAPDTSVEPAVPPPGQVAQTPTVLVAALGASSRQVARAVRHLAAQRSHEGGFDAVVVTTVRPPSSVAGTGIDVEPILGRRRWKGPAEQWPEYAQKRLRGIARQRGARTITVLDVAHPDAWIALGMRLALTDSDQPPGAEGE